MLALAGMSKSAQSAPVPHFAPKAKRVVHLFMNGGPSQVDTFDPKPMLTQWHGKPLPVKNFRTERHTGHAMGSPYKFKRYGQSGLPVSEIFAKTAAAAADDLCVIRSMHTEAINHDPAITFFQTGAQLSGRPSIGSWLSYGLGSLNENLPAFVALVSGEGGQPLYDRLWGSGFLPSKYQGVKFRSVGDPVLFLSDPKGIGRETRRRMLDDLSALNELNRERFGDPEIATRIAQYEMAYRMQTSVPELLDTSKEPEHITKTYGPDVAKRGTYAANCLLARRLCERGVRFVQLFHRGWDHHTDLPEKITDLTRATDQPTAALLADLKQRGLLKDTLVVWGGEFGRTIYCQGKLTRENYGRDHHPRCFSLWLAGAGVRGGMVHGETDDFSYNITRDPVHVHDLHATMLHLMGIDHERLTFKYQGRHHRLTDVHGKLVKPIMA